MPRFFTCLSVTLAVSLRVLGHSAELDASVQDGLDACNVVWNVPGPTSSESMPIGNGEIGLNVWAEPNGDVLFHVATTDAWNDNAWWQSFEPVALLKLGAVRLSLDPNPLTNGAPFSQILKLREGEIQITEGAGADAVVLRIRVDANHPVVRVEVATAGRPVSVRAALINWRLNAANPDVVLANQTNRITWYHRNRSSANSNVANLTFGAAIDGGGFTNVDSQTLASSTPASNHLISVHPLTAATATEGAWLSELDRRIARTKALSLEETRRAHRDWWKRFWQRSWILLEGDRDARNVTRGYVLQRFVTASAGRGRYPIKFNGSLFVADNPAAGRTADFRDWGGQYWFQNTRAMYWPRMAAGDFDMMEPLFRMYVAQIPGNSAQVADYYKHEGAYFAETAPFWGGLKYMGPEMPQDWTGHYFLPILELSMMMLDYFDYTGDTNFAQGTLLPVAGAGLKFYDQHFPRGPNGRLLLDPVNSIEMFWKVHNPAPDIAGLRAVLPRIIALTNVAVPGSERSNWVRLLAELPELPVDPAAGKLLPYSGPQTNASHNAENPELYAVHPFRLYGVGKPDLNLALNTFQARRFTQKGCWVQDPIQAAMLGLAPVAKEYVTFNFTNQAPGLKFPAFWAKMNDYAPDQDNGGCAEHALQQMLMQTDGRRILLLPAWPKEWTGSFKLHAPFQTTVQGRIVNGHLKNLIVTPAERLADVRDLSQEPVSR
jgi:alpha-L-fucosidase 2